MHIRILSTVISMVFLALSGAAFVCSAAETASMRHDGGKSVTRTGVRSSECSVFSKTGDLMCQRTFATVDHKVAIAKCVSVRCGKK